MYTNMEQKHLLKQRFRINCYQLIDTSNSENCRKVSIFDKEINKSVAIWSSSQKDYHYVKPLWEIFWHILQSVQLCRRSYMSDTWIGAIRSLNAHRSRMWTRPFSMSGVHAATNWLPFDGSQNGIFRWSFKLNLSLNFFY